MRKQLLAVMVVTGIAQVAGFAKFWVTARLFGVGADLDGYNLALVVPTLLTGVISGMVQTGLFPVRARLAATGDADAVARFERSVVVGLLLVGVALASTLLALGPWLQTWVASGASPSVLQALRLVWPYAASLVALNAAGDTLGYLLAMRDRYVYAAAAPIANAALGTAILVAWPEGGLLSLALSTVLGLALQVTLCAAVLQRNGLTLFGPLPRRAAARLQWKELGQLAALILPATIFSNMTGSLPAALLAHYGEGAVSAFGYAYRLHLFAVQLLVMAGSPIILARFSDLASERNDDAISRLLAKAARLSLLIGCGAVAVVGLFGSMALEAVFGGRFDATAAQRVGSHWLWLTIGLAPTLLGNVYAKLWQAERRPIQLSVLAFATLLTFLGGSIALAWPLQEFGVPAALSLSSLGTAICFWLLTRNASNSHRFALYRASNEIEGIGE